MSITIFEACKKRKRRPKLYGFHAFANPGCPIALSGAFRDNIRLFLQECGEIEDFNVEGMPTWCTMLVNENSGVFVPLYTIEETVKHSTRPFCDQCRCIGWSHHFVSKRRYHIIIPIDDDWDKPLEANAFDINTHLLHGLIHCNGFGHLLCINGLEGGSKCLCGREIMDLWDRLCTTLRTRKITVEDVSKKRSMDIRLLHGIAYGHPWFGKWGYTFCRGSFGVTEQKYNKAIQILSSLGLDEILDSGRSTQINQIICYYREVSETHLFTFRDLLRFMLAVKARAPVQRKNAMANAASSSSSTRSTSETQNWKFAASKGKPVKYRKFTPLTANMDSRWPRRRLESTAEVVLEALKENKLQHKNGSRAGMSRQEVRDVARLQIGDTGLLDFVLKSLNNCIVGDYVIRRSVNPSTRVLEYTIDEVVDGVIVAGDEPETVAGPVTEKTTAMASISIAPATSSPGSDVYGDVVYLYRNVLLSFPDSELLGLATRVILNAKHFVKEWPFVDDDDELLRFMCRLKLTADELTRELPPGELVVVPPYATVGELKEATERAMRDMYFVTEGFVVREMEGLDGIDDSEVLFGVMESGEKLWVRGTELDLQTELRYEGGADNWTVDCECGARDDDGERMVACDICEVWQHTRCSGVEDGGTVPPLFLCRKCSSSLMPPKAELLVMEVEAEYY